MITRFVASNTGGEGFNINILSENSENNQTVVPENQLTVPVPFSDNVNASVEDFNNPSKIEFYIMRVCKFFDKSPKEVLKNTRKRDVIKVRQTIMYYAKKCTRHSLSQIGKKVGGKDHATVLHAKKTIQGYRDIYKTFDEKLKQFESEYGIEFIPETEQDFFL